MSYSIASFPQDCPKGASSPSPDGVLNGAPSQKSRKIIYSSLWTNVEDRSLLEIFIKCKSVLEAKNALFWGEVAKKMNTERSTDSCRHRFYFLMDYLPLPIQHSFVKTESSEIATISTPEAVETALELSSFFTYGGTLPKIIAERLPFITHRYKHWTEAEEDKLSKAVEKYESLGKIPCWWDIAKELGHEKASCQSKFSRLRRRGKLG